MPTLAWLTDLHLDHVHRDEHDRVYQTIAARCADTAADAVLVGGDTATARSLLPCLERMSQVIERPLHLVLGNHDYYRGSIRDVRHAVRDLAARSAWIRWLPASGPIPLAPDTVLVGHGGWGDGRLGSGGRSEVQLADFSLIAELRGLGPAALFEQLGRLGDEAAASLASALEATTPSHTHVLVLTHVPPFREACWHEGQISGDPFLPHFACAATGAVLRAFADAHPARQVTVLCGHTHSPGEARIRPNLHVRTGGARYGEPAVQDVITVGGGTRPPPAAS